jgi:hypothetical protein
VQLHRLRLEEFRPRPDERLKPVGAMLGVATTEPGTRRSWLVPARRTDPEIMDGEGQSEEEMAAALGEIRSVNRWLGGLNAVLAPLAERARRGGWRRLSVLDVGTGSADIPRALAQGALGGEFEVRAAGVDLHPLIAKIARDAGGSGGPGTRDEVPILRGDGLRLPFRDGARRRIRSRGPQARARERPRAAPGAVARDPAGQPPSGHLEDVSLRRAALGAARVHGRGTARDRPGRRVAARVSFDREAARVARRLVLVNDLERHRAPWLAIRLVSLLLGTSKMFRYDAPLSVLRAFTAEELLAIGRRAGLPPESLSIEKRPAWRLVLCVDREAGIRDTAR